jgi:hypothetical protein
LAELKLVLTQALQVETVTMAQTVVAAAARVLRVAHRLIQPAALVFRIQLLVQQFITQAAERALKMSQADNQAEMAAAERPQQIWAFLVQQEQLIAAAVVVLV